MKTEKSVLLEILSAVGARPASYGFERPTVPTLTREQIDAAVDELRRGRYVVAAPVPSAFGDNPAYWAPSVLTVPGRHLLEELRKTA